MFFIPEIWITFRICKFQCFKSLKVLFGYLQAQKLKFKTLYIVIGYEI